MKRIVALLIAAAAFSSSAAFATIIHVPGDSATIQAGINGAVNGDTVLVADGTYTGDGNRDIDFGGKNVVLKSENGPEVTIIDCQGTPQEPHRAFHFHSGENSAARVEGFTIRGGYVSDLSQGGAILCTDGSNPTIAGNVIINNHAANGGGGVWCSYSNPVLVGNFLQYNSADDGGAIGLGHSNAIIADNVLAHNQVPYEGGALSLWGSNPVMVSNTIVSNTAAGGGAMFICNSSPTLDKCLVAFNRGHHAILCAAGCPPSSPDLYCTNVFGNHVGDWVGCIADQAGINGNFSLDPLFCDTVMGDYHISGPSPCAPAYSSCGVLIGALGVGCATEPIAVIDPDTMYVFQAHTIDTTIAVIYFGGFTDGHTVADIDPATILVNGSINPTSWTLLPSHPNFYGEAMEITFPIRDFILGYMPLWDTTIQEYSVSGQFNDNTEFVVSGEVTMIGHTSGDVNGDGAVNIADLTYLIDFLFNGGAKPPVPETADLDHSGAVNVADVTELVRVLFG